MEQAQNLTHTDSTLPAEFSRLDSASADMLGTTQVYSPAHDEAYRRLVRLKTSIALIATLLLLAISILILAASA